MTLLCPFPSALSLSLHFLTPSHLHLLARQPMQQIRVLAGCHADSINFISSKAVDVLYSPQRGRCLCTGRPLTELFGALAVAR